MIKALRAAPCRNRIEALGWFLGQRFFDDSSELLLKLEIGSRICTIPVEDIQILMAGLALFTPANPWERWRPEEEPHTVIDLGGNLGLSSLYFAVRFPQAKIVSVEMMHENAAAIKRLTELNHVGVDIANIAVGATDGIATVQLNQSHSRHRLSLLRAEESKEIGASLGFTNWTSTVPVSRLGSLIDKLGWPSVDLLKIDIEGAEQLLLDDIEGWAGFVKTVFLEVHHNVDARFAEERMLAHAFRKIGEDSKGRRELWFTK
jgi:FkbM family methyltransferase